MQTNSWYKPLKDVIPREVRVLVMCCFLPNLWIVDLHKSDAAPQFLLLFSYGHLNEFMMIA
jgi:hypothetical protein